MEEIEELLRIWDQAGERPYEVLQELGVYDEFLQYLNESQVLPTQPIYRGTLRHQELQQDDLLEYTYPTSWSSSENIAKNFISEMPDPVILVFSANELVNGVYNTENTYDEREVILAPIIFTVIDRQDIDGYIYLHLEVV